MRRRPVVLVGLAAVLATLLVPGAAVSVVQIADGTSEPAEVDTRTGRLAPTKAQRSAVKKLKASVTWNRYGTPATLTKRGKFLARDVRGQSAVAAARNWLEANRALLGLRSTAGLRLDSDTRMRGSRGHAVNFRQVFDGLEAAEGGLVTVGLTGRAPRSWKVAFVSSSLTRDTALAEGEVECQPDRRGPELHAWSGRTTRPQTFTRRSASAVGRPSTWREPTPFSV